jgi:hypothetical protein
MAKKPKAKFVDIFPCIGQTSGVVLYQDKDGDEREIRLINFDNAMKRLKALIVSTRSMASTPP